MKNVLIAFAAIALLSTAAVFLVHHKEQAELEKIHIHVPHIHLPKIHLKVNFSALGQCAGVLTGAVTQCGAAIDTVGGDISGDIGCVKSIVSAKACGHIF